MLDSCRRRPTAVPAHPQDRRQLPLWLAGRRNFACRLYTSGLRLVLCLKGQRKRGVKLMLRRIIPFCFVAAIAMIPIKAAADPITIMHKQTMVDEEELGSIPTPGNVTTTVTVLVTVTNDTNFDWDDYTIRIVSLTDSGSLSISSFKIPAGPFDAGSRSKNKLMVHYTDGTVPQRGSFTAELGITYRETSVTFYGTPSVEEEGAPEPSTLILLGSGLLGWATLKRRRG